MRLEVNHSWQAGKSCRFGLSLDDNSPDRAYINACETPAARNLPHTIIPIEIDNRIKPAFYKREKGFFIFFSAYIDTLAAQDTSVRIVIKKRVRFTNRYRFKVFVKIA